MKFSLNPKTYLKADSKELFCFGARWAFGFWLLYLGVMKWIGGPENFVGYINGAFAETWVPARLLTVMSWLILILEPLLGALLILGWKERLVWITTAKLMFLLIFGQTILQEWGSVANNWQYLFFCIALAAFSGPCDCKNE